MIPTIPPRAHAMGTPLLACLALAACASSAEPSVYLVDERSVAGLPEGAAHSVDLRDPDAVHVLDRTQLDDSQLHLICPNGVGMGLAEWLREQGPEYERSETLVLAADPSAMDAVFAEAQGECGRGQVCRACPDGVTVCRSRCGAASLANHGPGRDPAEGVDGPEEPSPAPESPSSGSGDGASAGGAGAGSGGSPGADSGR